MKAFDERCVAGLLAASAAALAVRLSHGRCGGSAGARSGAATGTSRKPSAAPSQAPPPACRNTGDFGRWLATFRADAGKGRRHAAHDRAALDGMTLDDSIIRRDRGQAFFAQSFLEFQGKLATQNRVTNAKAMLAKHKALFDKVEKEYGMPGTVITGLWALESDFGSGMGKLPVLRSLATLAYDCRRGDMFRAELMAALKIIDKGDLRPSDMVGSWAGELGQTQFLPTHYDNYAIDYDGDGRRDLFRSIPDIVASSANYIRAIGWKAGEPWLEEVRVPERLPWEQANLDDPAPALAMGEVGRHARQRPAAARRRRAGLAAPADGAQWAGVHRLPEFQRLHRVEQVAELRDDGGLSGDPDRRRARRSIPGRAPVQVLDAAAMKEMQILLARRGTDVGVADGRLGCATRAPSGRRSRSSVCRRTLSELRVAGPAAPRSLSGRMTVRDRVPPLLLVHRDELLDRLPAPAPR